MKGLTAALAAVSLFGVIASAHAQDFYGLHEKGIERINAATRVTPLSVDTLFGDQVSQFNGGAEFTSVDIAVPGNSGLPVELRRSLKVDDRSRLNGLHLGGFAEWDIEVPHLSGIFSSVAGGWRPGGGTPDQRCSVPGTPPFAGSISPEDYWNGYQLHVPGAADQSLLMNPSPLLPIVASGASYPWITKEMWRIRCEPVTKNGYAGQSFVALSPEGVTYHFDWVVSKSHAGLKNISNSYAIPREVIYFLASRVEDRFGNWVNYTYSGDKLTSITSSDGRQITLTYVGTKVSVVDSNIGRWSYTYNGEKLAQVSRPDGSKWTYASTGALAMDPPVSTPEILDPTGCPDPLEGPTGNYALTITAPSGATGQFNFEVLLHRRSSVPNTCVIIPPSYYYLKIPRQYWSLTLTSKTVTGPGLPGMSWSYTYGQPNPLHGGDVKQNVVIGPGGIWRRYEFGTGVNINEGQLLKVEQGTGPSDILRTQTNVYVSDAEASAQIFPAKVGSNPHVYSDSMGERLRPLKQTTILQQSTTFTWKVDDCSPTLCFDVFARPTSVTKSSAPSP